MRYIVSRASVLVVAAFGVALLTLTETVAAQNAERAARAEDDRSRCSLRQLRGTFSVLASGFIVTPPPGSGVPTGPFATVGTLAIDGGGHAVLNATRSFNGQIVSDVDLPGRITLTADCRGSAEFQGGRTFDVVVLNSQDEMNWIQTNPGTVVTVVFKRL
jgi:hypothetical protein